MPGKWGSISSQGGLVTFRSHDPSYQLPSPFNLEAHAAVAKILNATGMAEYIDSLLDEKTHTRCLESDGSTNLDLCLFPFLPVY